MANIPVTLAIKTLLDADNLAQSKAALIAIGAAVWNFVGVYSGGASYAVGDVVTYQGQTWYRLNANGGNVGDTPSEGAFWTILAQAGAGGGGAGTPLTGDVTTSGSVATIATGAVTVNKIGALAVTNAKLAVGAAEENITLLPVAKGGTGATAFTTGSVLVGAGTSAPTLVAPSTAGNVLTSNGSTWQSLPEQQTTLKFFAMTALVAEPGIISANIGGLTLLAADAVPGKSFALDCSLIFDGSSSPITGADKIYLVARLGLGTPVFTSGAWLNITPINVYEAQRFNLTVSLLGSSSSPYNIRPSFSILSIERMSAADLTSPASALPFSVITVDDDNLVYSNSPGVATTLEFYLALKSVAGDFSLTLISGSIAISRQVAVTAYLT